MLEIELCRICLADSIKMYPIEHTRYDEVFVWYTEDTVNMNDELPCSVCYLCNAVLNRLYGFLKQMIDTEVYLKEILRNTSKLTYETVEQLKRQMISKPHNLSKIWLRNSNFIALDAFKGHRPPRELQRYFDNPPIMIEYHKPYEHVILEDLPEEQEHEEINEEEPKETKQAESEEMEVEIEQIKEAESEKIKEAETENINEAETEELRQAGTKELKEAGTEESKEAETDKTKEADTEEKMEVESDQIKDKEPLQQKSKLPAQKLKSPRPQKKSSEIFHHYDEKSLENEDQRKPPEEKFGNKAKHTDNDSETTADQSEFANDDDEINSEEDINLVWSPEIEYESLSTPNMEIYDKPFIEKLNHKSESKFSNMLTSIPDSIDSFLLCAKKYRPPEEIAKPSNGNVAKEDHNPYLEVIEENIEIEKEPQEKKVQTTEPVKFHNPYLQFIEPRIPTEDNPPKKSSNTSEQRVQTSDPEKYENQNLQFIERIIVKKKIETEQRQTKIDKKIDTGTPSVQQKTTELTAIQHEKKSYNVNIEPVKETLFKTSNESIVIEKSTPVGGRPNKPVSKLIKPPTSNKLSKIIVTCEPSKYINSYVDFVTEMQIKDKIREHMKESNQEIVPIRPKKSNLKNKSSKKVVPINPLQEKLSEENFVDGKIRGYYCDNQKTYHRASILRKTHLPNINKRKIKELANKIKNRAAILRNEQLKFQKTDLKAEKEKVVEKEAVTKPAPYDEAQTPGISKVQAKSTPKHLALKSHSDKLLKEIPRKLPKCVKNRNVWHVVENPVKSKHTDRVSDAKDQNQGGHYNAVIDQGDQNAEPIFGDQEENTVDCQIDRALKVLDESLDEDRNRDILRNEGDQENNMPCDQNNHENDTTLQLKDVCIIIDDDLEDNNKPKDLDDPSLVVQNVFTLKYQGLEDDYVLSKEHYDQIVMLANQDDQVMEDGNVAVKIESVDEEVQDTFGENNEEENVLPDTIFNNGDIMDLNNGSNDQHGDFKTEDEQNILIDDEISKYEPYLQERVTINENTTQRDRDGPSTYENPGSESNYNEIERLNEQEHYAIRNISQVSLMPTVQLERLPISLIKKNSTKGNGNKDDDKYRCVHCDFTTTVRVLMFRHQNVHDMNKQFVCTVCQHRFLSHYHLSRHKVIHDRKKYYCAYCDFNTTVKFSMDKHQNVHNKLKRFLCHRCQRRFRSASHRARHSCAKKCLCVCEICNKTFRYEATYLRHLDKHAGVVPTGFKCSVCYKSFDCKKQYLYHYKLHGLEDSENLIYACKWCSKTFRHKGNCNKHMKLHEKYGEMVSHETEDKQEEHETDEMELHGKERTEDEKFVCGLCPKSFDTEIELGKHAVDHIL